MIQDNTTPETTTQDYTQDTIRERLERILFALEIIKSEMENKRYSVVNIDMGIRNIFVELEDENVEW